MQGSIVKKPIEKKSENFYIKMIKKANDLTKLSPELDGINQIKKNSHKL